MLSALERSGGLKFAYRRDGFAAYGDNSGFRDDSTIDADFEVVSDGKPKAGPTANSDQSAEEDPKSLPNPGQGWGRRNG
jgi:hypothetical protein